MLRTSLNGHSTIETKSEIFNPDFLNNEPFNKNTPAQEIIDNHLFCDYKPLTQAVGFILHRSGASFGNWPDLWSTFEADKALKVIRLTRHNLLRRYLSYCKMRDKNRNIPLKPRVFTVQELKQEFTRHEAEVAAFEERFSDHETIRVSYEDLCHDYQATMYRLQLFLDVPISPLKPHTQKNSISRMDQDISNFDELREAFQGSRWAWFFEQANMVSGKASFRLGL
ncbi:MAG: hypothetical protein HRU21_11580 [Pseudomonadales bacterium]|nr:hypothetical protein [Pseudomonadales bacterium]